MTPYAAPDQFDPSLDLDEPGKQTDVHASATVACETFTGESPVHGRREWVIQADIMRPSEHASVPAAVDGAPLPALAPDPSDRSDTTHTVAQGL